MSRLLLPLSSLALASCAAWPEVSTLPDQVQERIRARDPRLQQLYERYHPVPGPGLHVKTAVRAVPDSGTGKAGVQGWVFVSGSW